MAEINLAFIILEIEAFYCAIFAFIIMTIAYSRYRKRISQITKNAFYIFVFIGLLSLSSAVVFLLDALSVEYLSFINIIPSIPMLFTIYFVYTFAQTAFAEEREKLKLNIFVKVMLVIGIILCVLRDFFIPFPSLYLLTSFLRYIWMEAFAFISVIPIIIGGIQLRGRVAKDNIHYSQISNILQMAIFFLLTDIVFLADALFRLFSGVFPNAASFFTWVFLFLALYSAYRSLFSKVKKTQIKEEKS